MVRVSNATPSDGACCWQVALSDTALLREMLLPLPDFSDPIQTANATAAFYVRRKPLSATVNTLANALYAVSTATGPLHAETMKLLKASHA